MSTGDFSEHVEVRRPDGRCVHAWRRPGSTRPVPAQLLYAEWSVGAGTPPAYTDDEAAAVVAASDGLVTAEVLPGHDHAGVVMTGSGAAASVRALRRSLAG